MANNQNTTPLWERVKTKNIEPRTKYEDRTEAAAYCRKVLKARFPEVKFSVHKSKSGYLTYCYIISSPYEENSDIMNTIKEYCHTLLESRHYDHMVLLDSNYIQTEPTAEQQADISDYYEQQERERKERWAQYQKEQAEKEARWEAYRIQEQKDKEAIKADVKIVDLTDEDCFVVCHCEEGLGKEDCLDEVKEDIAQGITDGYYHCTDMCISRKMIFTDGKVLERFNNLFLADFPEYFHGYGGTAIVDTRANRISQNGAISYWNWCGKLTAEQRADLHYCNVNCVGVYLGDKLQYVVDPQGHSYARYVALIPDGWTAEQAIPWNEYKQKHQAYTATLEPFYIEDKKGTVTLMSDEY